MSNRPVAVLAALCLALAPLPAAPSLAVAGAQDEREELADLGEVRAELLATARALAELADDVRADLERDRILRCVLALDPDDADARKALGYRKKKGEWVLGKYAEPRNRAGDEDLAALAQRRLAAGRALAERLEACFPSERPTPAQRHERRENFALLAAVAGDDADLRARGGQAWDEEAERWTLIEVVAAKRDRAARVELFAELAAARGKPQPAELDPGAAATGVRFAGVASAPGVLVASTVSFTDAADVAAAMHDTYGFVRATLLDPFEVVDPNAALVETCYDLGEGGALHAFLSAHPAYDGPPPSQVLGPRGFGHGYGFVFAPDLDYRRASAAGMYLATTLAFCFPGTYECGWLSQGLLQFVGYEVYGSYTYRDFENLGSDEDRALGARLFADVPEDWLAIAAELFVDEGRPLDLAAALEADVRTMTPEQQLAAYAFAAFGFEARREALVEALRSWPAGGDRLSQTEHAFGAPLEAVADLVVRWLDELRPRPARR